MNELILGDALEELIDYRGKTPKKLGADFTNSGVPVASALLVSNGTLNLADARTVSHETHQSWMKTQTRKGDVLLTSEAPLGRVARVPSDDPLVLGQRLFGLRGKLGILDNGYLYYALQTADVQADLVGRSSGTTVFGIRQSALRQVKIAAPGIEDQRAIAEVLGALDDKIAANTKLIALLDSHMALEYTASLANGGFERPLGDVARFHNRRRIPLSARERDQRPGDVPYYGASGVFGTVDKAIFDEQLVLVGEDGSVMNVDGTPVVQYIWGPAWVNNHAHVLTGMGLSTEVLFQAIARTQVATLVTGAVQPKINMGNLKGLRLELPDTAELRRLESIVGAETAIKRATTEENRTLAGTRDVLLPQVMSGKLRVKDAEKVLENAGV
jgi:type I restriction enzyme S subunit